MATPKNNTTTDRRAMAKWGMAASMGTLLITGLMGPMRGPGRKNQRNLHLWSGMALVGFSLWHYSLYQPKR